MTEEKTCGLCNLQDPKYKDSIEFEDEIIYVTRASITARHLATRTLLDKDGRQIIPETPDAVFGEGRDDDQKLRDLDRFKWMDGYFVALKEHRTEFNEEEKSHIRVILKQKYGAGILDWDCDDLPDHARVEFITEPLPASRNWEFLR